MEKYNLSDGEKKILRALADGKGVDELSKEMPSDELRAYSKRLKEYGLVSAQFNAIGGLPYLLILRDEGTVYLKENSSLEYPSDHQKDEHAKKKKRLWPAVLAVIGVIGLILGVIADAFDIVEKLFHFLSQK